jgi:polyhydroxybutyrate depolymerase
MIYVLIVAVVVLISIGFRVAISVYNATSPRVVFQHPQKGPPRTGFSSRVLESGNQTRGYLLYVPHRYRPEQTATLVISLHGFASSPGGQRYLSDWEKLAEKEGFIVVYPQGTNSPLRWNASNILGTDQIDDVSFMRDLLADLEKLLNIDKKRRYINGMSNGGGMTARLAWAMPDVFAAAGIVSGPPLNIPIEGNKWHPVPLIAFYGTADPLVKYAGGTATTSILTKMIRLPAHRVTLPPVQPWILSWAERNGCNPIPEALPVHGDAHGVRYSGEDEASEVVFYTITDGGHTWPGGSPTFLGKTSHSIDATTEMWAFFKAHPQA